ncbi:uncharacterized protein LOC116847249 [Odontomachus brunneus]|uniref:uncharacterized protein LOC116847249 n=1 Tax=Odontomachus brunneus TaxID=486640 RepID=UPI0013F263CB|nr:uncharacterized protein LOC116847249 [Odontomachus brunneus]
MPSSIVARTQCRMLPDNHNFLATIAVPSHLPIRRRRRRSRALAIVVLDSQAETSRRAGQAKSVRQEFVETCTTYKYQRAGRANQCTGEKRARIYETTTTTVFPIASARTIGKNDTNAAVVSVQQLPWAHYRTGERANERVSYRYDKIRIGSGLKLALSLLIF